ncbi:NAD(P)H-dependent oxidoreductase [bacterium]|nr:NAD(P)H-dependent oxidoreductase [bacterium]
MKTSIVFAHPWHGSFNKAVLDVVVESLSKRKKDYEVLDLNKDGFDPVMQESDLALFSKGQSKDKLVQKYQDILKDTDEVVFIFPIWWFGMPAILKGFIDKVMLKGYAYDYGKIGLIGKLTNIKRTTIITSSEMPTLLLRFGFGSPISSTMKAILKGLGMKNIKWLNKDFITKGKEKGRKKFLDKVKRRFS